MQAKQIMNYLSLNHMIETVATRIPKRMCVFFLLTANVCKCLQLSVGCFHSPFTTMCERAHEIRAHDGGRLLTHSLAQRVDTLNYYEFFIRFSKPWTISFCLLLTIESYFALFLSLQLYLLSISFFHSWRLRQHFESITQSYVSIY